MKELWKHPRTILVDISEEVADFHLKVLSFTKGRWATNDPEVILNNYIGAQGNLANLVEYVVFDFDYPDTRLDLSRIPIISFCGNLEAAMDRELRRHPELQQMAPVDIRLYNNLLAVHYDPI